MAYEAKELLTEIDLPKALPLDFPRILNESAAKIARYCADNHLFYDAKEMRIILKEEVDNIAEIMKTLPTDKEKKMVIFIIRPDDVKASFFLEFNIYMP